MPLEWTTWKKLWAENGKLTIDQLKSMDGVTGKLGLFNLERILGLVETMHTEKLTNILDRSIETKRPSRGKVFPLREAAEAHRLMESRDFFGKIVLTP